MTELLMKASASVLCERMSFISGGYNDRDVEQAYLIIVLYKCNSTIKLGLFIFSRFFILINSSCFLSLTIIFLWKTLILPAPS